MTATERWWHGTTIYQIYPRSFADANGDGIGDLPGIVEHLDYIAALGVEVVWVSPFFKSPQRDFGYDVSDYCDVAPEYGTLADAERLIAETHRRGMKVMFDLVLNHSSDEHPWFRESRRSRDGAKANWYVWADGRGPNGRKPPNNWRSALEVQSAWKWCEERAQWYLASFLPCQPDLNWHEPAVKAAMFDVVRFWLERGVDGFRLDMFGAIMHDAQLRDVSFGPHIDGGGIPRLWRRDRIENTPENVQLARELRAVCDEFSDPERILLGEVFGSPDVSRSYLGEDDGLQLTFLFQMLGFRYSAEWFRRTLQHFEKEFAEPSQPTYVLENHDRSRSIDRVGGDVRKARVLAAILAAARGVTTLYMGQEIGMANTYIPLPDALDPVARPFARWLPEWISKRLPERLNRDEVRTPMQWSDAPNAGFCPQGVRPWLPAHPDFGSCNVAAQEQDDDSMLALYRRLFRLRRESAALRRGAMTMRDDVPATVLAFDRVAPGETIRVAANFDDRPVRLEVDGELLVATHPGVTVVSGHVTLPEHTALLWRSTG